MVAGTDSTVAVRRGVGQGLDTGAGPTFIQDRLRLFGKTVFLLSFGFYVLINGIFIATGVVAIDLLAEHHNVWHLASASVCLVLWVLAGVRPWPTRVLGALDASGVLLPGLGLSVMAAGQELNTLWSATLAITVTMMARGILVPSTAKRTLTLSILMAAPLLVTSFVFFPMPVPPGAPSILAIIPTVSSTLWMTIAVALSTVASSTIFGLRQQVREASEIGQYTLDEKIGSGGMGEVWRAHHRMLIRPAAVKLIRPGAIGTAPTERQLLMRRFEREAHATAGLRSPHTVQLYDFGITDDGTLYYVMELLDGMDLDTMITRFGPMPAERAIHLLLQLCASLDDAHQNGLVHRDIKPANVVVSRSRSAWDFVKVLDFGLVKLEGTRRSDIKLTDTGSASGTPGFMAPEVALGHDDTDHRVDIYAVGCVAYWLVTGKLVFEGPTSVAVMLAHAHNPPPPPSSRTELAIPPELEALILECLDKDPAKRPATAETLQARLQAIPVAAPWTRERAERWWSVHAPGTSAARPVADVLLSREASPLRVIRQARPS